MRKLILALVLSLNFFASVKASDFIKVTADKNLNNAFVVKLSFDNPSDVTIRLASEWGNEISSKQFDAITTFEKRYKLKGVEDGNYNLIITTGNKSTVQPIQIENSRVTVSDELRSYIKPHIVINEDHLYLNMLAFSDKKISFQLLNESGEIIYSKALKGEINLKKAFDLVNLPSANYVVRIHNTDIDYTYSFNK